MTKIFIIHGSYGNPDENWFPWLKQELEALGHTVFVPKFSTPENQSLEKWMKEFEYYQHLIDEDTIFVGHSLAPAFILSILEKLETPKPIKACFFVSGFLGLLGDPKFDEINKTFTAKDFNWEKIKKNCKEFHNYHSDNDPYIPLKVAKEFAQKLGVDINLIKGAGHFNESTGYTKFDILLENILKVL